MTTRAPDLPEAFYLPQADGTYLPTRATVGPWDPALQHGGPPAALLGRELERVGGRDDVRVAHFTLDFLGTVPLAPMTLQTEIVRPGKRVELAVATASVGGRAVLRASAWRIAVGGGRSPMVGMDEPAPPLPDREDPELFEAAPSFGYGQAIEWRFASGGFRVKGPATVWSRLRIPLVPGEAPSPLARLLAMVDSANGVSWELDVRTHSFVPVALTVSVTRAPEGDWVGMNARTSLAGDGIGTTRARVFDARGTLGEALQALFVAPR
jgi:hypothetical protein